MDKWNIDQKIASNIHEKVINIAQCRYLNELPSEIIAEKFAYENILSFINKLIELRIL